MGYEQLNSRLRTHGHVRGFVPPLPETLGQYISTWMTGHEQQSWEGRVRRLGSLRKRRWLPVLGLNEQRRVPVDGCELLRIPSRDPCYGCGFSNLVACIRYRA